MNNSSLLLFGATLGATLGSGFGSVVGDVYAGPLTTIAVAMGLCGLLGAMFAAAVAGKDESWPTVR